MQIICKTAYKKSILIAICLLQVAIFDICAQHPIDIGARGSYNFSISPRWSGAVDAMAYRQFNSKSGTWERVALKGLFSFMERRYLFASASVSIMEFDKINNTDVELRLVEGINMQTLNNFIHSIYLSQRRIIYSPSNDKAFCSDISYYQQFNITLKNDRITPFIAASETINITPDISDAPILQRFRFGAGAIIKLGERISMTLNYNYALGSKRQSFIGDCHKLNNISLIISNK